MPRPDPVGARLAVMELQQLQAAAAPAPVLDPEAMAQAVADWDGVDRKDLTAAILSRLSELQQQARQRGDLRTALRALEAMTRLARLQA